MDKILVFIPTYNEKDNITILLTKIANLKIEGLTVLVIDDNSPDKTADRVKKFTVKYKNVLLICRNVKSGIGSAHKYAINWAYKNKYSYLLTMDADLTHDPKYIKKLINHKDTSDLLIMSRYLIKNSMVGWSFTRKLMTFISHNMIKHLFNLPHDTSNAYRLYNLKTLNKSIFKLVKSDGYSFFFESLYRIKSRGYKIKELPIVMHERTMGESKMSLIDILLYIKTLMYLLKIKYGYER